MGKLSDFFAKIKGLFNRNKALPEVKEENYIMPNISERKEEAKMTEHENFVNTLQKQAKSFDLSQMPVEDAISKALEEKGLNSNIANNPEFKKQVNKIFEDIFQHQSTPTTEMAETLHKAINSQTHGNYKFEVTPDGNFLFKEIRTQDSMTLPQTNATLFTADKNGNLNVISTTEHTFLNEEKKIILNTKTQSTFSKDGLETQKTNAYLDRTYQPSNNAIPTVSERTETIIRNDNLLVATQFLYDKTNLRIEDFVGLNSFPDSLGLTDKKINIDAIGQYPEYLNYTTRNISEVAELNEKLEKHRNDFEQGYPQNGTEFYEKICNKYNCIPEAVTPDEKAYRTNYIKSRLDNLAKTSPLIKKIAEQRGLIDKSENVMEQE